jgi:hypothetical protein
MADLKISQLSAATALAGTELVPVVQGGATKKATIDQILAPASGKGIDFSAAGGDTLTMYEEGTWTPTITAGSGSITAYTAAGYYTRIGRQVFVNGTISISNNGTGGTSIDISNLPFAIAGGVAGGMSRENAVNGKMSSITASGASTLIMFTYDNLYPGGTGTAFQFSATYFV